MKYDYILPMDFIDPNILEPGEILAYVTQDMVPGVYLYYMISTSGRVYHRYLNRFMKPGLETSGYLFITLSTEAGPKIVQLNRLVLMAFCPIPNPSLYQANHKNGDKLNNHLYNLEWTTRSENQKHAYLTGLHKQPPNTVLSENQAIQIVDMLKSNMKCTDIAEIMKIDIHLVSSIKKKEAWRHLTRNIEFDQRVRYAYSEDDVRKLCEYFQSNPKPKSLMISEYVYDALIKCGFDDPKTKVETARKIYTRRHYTNISKDYNF